MQTLSAHLKTYKIVNDFTQLWQDNTYVLFKLILFIQAKFAKKQVFLFYIYKSKKKYCSFFDLFTMEVKNKIEKSANTKYKLN